MSEWRPIETASLDADSLSPILVIDRDGLASYDVAYVGWIDDDGGVAWFNGNVRVYPTHWQPLPEPPQ